jgi:hypothetical protein
LTNGEPRMFRSVEMEKENRYSFAAHLLGCEELHAVTKMKAYVRRPKDFLHQKAEVEAQPPLG